MKPGTIVYTGKTKKGTNILIRYPLKTDVEEMTLYINTLSNERTFILFQGEQQTLKKEEKYLRSIFTKLRKKIMVKLLVFHDNTLIGSSEIEMKEKAEKHVGNFGLSVAKEFRGEGIGTLLLKLVLEKAEKHLPDLRVCVLGVFSDNNFAVSMYQKVGFIPYGRLPNGLKHKDHYVDHIFMYKEMNPIHEKETTPQ